MTDTSWHTRAKEMWDEKADFWHSNSQNMWDHGSRKSIIPFVLKHFKSESRVLDLGCGDGYGSYKLWSEGFDMTGVDLSEEMVTLCESRLTKDMSGMRFFQGDMLNLPFDTDSFDGLMAINAMEWAEVPVDGLLEMKRVIKPGGHLCIGVLGPTAMPRANSYERLYGREVIMNTMMPWEFQKLAEENLLTVIDQEFVYKRGVDLKHVGSLPEDLRQSLTFMTLFMLKI